MAFDLGVNQIYGPTSKVTASAGSTSGSFSITSNVAGTRWQRYKLEFIDSATSTVSELVGADPSGNHIALDNVSVTLFIPEGDIDGNGCVDDFDLFLLTQDFLSAPGSASGTPNTDLNHDGSVDDFDLFTLTNHFLEGC